MPKTLLKTHEILLKTFNILCFVSLATVILFVVFFVNILFVSCSPVKRDVFTLNGNKGKVILHESYGRMLGYNPITLKLFYEKKNKRKLICNPSRHPPLYTEIKPEEHYLCLREALYHPVYEGMYNYSVFVNPKEFSLSEYEDIRDTLQRNASQIDEAIKTSMRGETEGLKICSIRYIDIESLKFSYSGKIKGYTLEVEASGKVKLNINTPNEGKTYIDIGKVTNNGESIDISPFIDTVIVSGKPVSSPKSFLMGFTSEKNRTLFDDFTVRQSICHRPLQ